MKAQDAVAGEVSDVLLARHHPRLSEHGLRRRRASRTTAVSHRLFVYDSVSYVLDTAEIREK